MTPELQSLAQAHRAREAAEVEVERLRKVRDALIVDLAAAGVTPYRIAKELGLAASTVGRLIVKREGASA